MFDTAVPGDQSLRRKFLGEAMNISIKLVLASLVVGSGVTLVAVTPAEAVVRSFASDTECRAYIEQNPQYGYHRCLLRRDGSGWYPVR
ncbi:hypothetical protein ACWEVD_09535 [Nocardia thailandica]